MSIHPGPTAPDPDWTDRLAASDRELLRGLPFRRLARVPPRKSSGLPLGHELRILGRFLSGRTSSLDPSAFTLVYLARLSRRERLVFRALVSREALARSSWEVLLGRAAEDWIGRGLLGPASGGWRSRFSVVPVGDLLLAVDPQETAFVNKIHVGQDSLNLLGFVLRRGIRGAGRVLDVGTGSGLLLVALARSAREAVGIDLNPRAVAAARINVALNGAERCRVEERDAFAPWEDGRRFDLVVWNAPFMFFPEGERERTLDGFGGELGIGVTLAYLERLPEVVESDGAALIMTAAPVLGTGENRLEAELRSRCARLGLDARVNVLQAFWSVEHAAFHRAHGIDHFESVILELEPGSGRVARRASRLQPVSDAARSLLYRARLGRAGETRSQPIG